MSSHHFVIEGQEPALIIANGAMCSYDLLTSLLEWCPFVVVLDGAMDRIQKLEVKPDVVIGDMDSLSLSINDIDVEVISVDDQDSTDLEKGIEYLIGRGYDQINIVWATGKRLDHTVNNFTTLAKYSEYKIVMYDDHSKAFCLPRQFSKSYPAGTSLSLFPITTAHGIVTQNLVHELNNESLELGLRSGSSNAAKTSGITSITYAEGKMILVESRD